MFWLLSPKRIICGILIQHGHCWCCIMYGGTTCTESMVKKRGRTAEEDQVRDWQGLGTKKVDKKLWILIAHLLGLVFCLSHTAPAANKAELGLPRSIHPDPSNPAFLKMALLSEVASICKERPPSDAIGIASHGPFHQFDAGLCVEAVSLCEAHTVWLCVGWQTQHWTVLGRTW